MFKNFRLWLANRIMPKPDYHDIDISECLAADKQGEQKSGVDFNIRRVANGTIITSFDWEAVRTNYTSTNGTEEPRVQYVVPEGEDVLPYIVSILAARKLK